MIPNPRPPNSLHHGNALLSDLFINGTHNLRTQPCGSAWQTRTHNETHPHSRGTAPQKSGDNSPKHGGMPKPKGGTGGKNPQRRLLTSALYPQPTMCQTNLSSPRSRIDLADVPHKGKIWHGNLQPMSVTKHLDCQ